MERFFEERLEALEVVVAAHPRARQDIDVMAWLSAVPMIGRWRILADRPFHTPGQSRSTFQNASAGTSTSPDANAVRTDKVGHADIPSCRSMNHRSRRRAFASCPLRRHHLARAMKPKVIAGEVIPPDGIGAASPSSCRCHRHRAGDRRSGCRARGRCRRCAGRAGADVAR